MCIRDRLGLLSYLHYFASFYNKEDVANNLYTTLSNRLSCITDTISSSKINKVLVNKKILWGNYYDYYGTIGWSLGTCPNYYCDAIKSANATFLDYSSILNIPSGTILTDSQFKTLAEQADIWIYDGFNYASALNMNTVLLNSLPVVQKNMVFGVFGRGQNDWFESRLLEADVLVEDILVALSKANTKLSINHSPVWIRPVYLSNNELDNPNNYGRGTCINVNQSLPLQGSLCSDLVINLDSELASSPSLSNDNETNTTNLIIGLCIGLGGLLMIVVAFQLYTCKRMREENVSIFKAPLIITKEGYSVAAPEMI